MRPGLFGSILIVYAVSLIFTIFNFILSHHIFPRTFKSGMSLPGLFTTFYLPSIPHFLILFAVFLVRLPKAQGRQLAIDRSVGNVPLGERPDYLVKV